MALIEHVQKQSEILSLPGKNKLIKIIKIHVEVVNTGKI